MAAAAVDAPRSPRPSSDAGPDAALSAAELDSGCVLDMGESRKEGDRLVTEKNGVASFVHHQASCWLEADCVHAHGRKTPGDAAVAIQCRGRRCVCRFESFVPKQKHLEFSFDTQDPCSDDARIESLLLGRCLPEGRRRMGLRGH